jgi:hypothetical protein
VRPVRWIPLGVILLALGAADVAAQDITEAAFEGRPHFMVRTERATWLYDRAGGGFSRLLDREGRDWINFGAERLTAQGTTTPEER